MNPKHKCDCIHLCGDKVNRPYCSAFDRAIERDEICNEWCCEYSNDESEED